MARGHLPSWKKLSLKGSAHLPILTRAVRAGHLNCVKELDTFSYNDDSLLFRSFLEAFKTREGKLETVILGANVPDDLPTRRAMLELLSSPVCSGLRKLEMKPNYETIDFNSAISFVSEYFRSVGTGGWPLLRELDLEWLDVDDISCLTDALLHDGGSAPNLEGIIFRGDDYVTLGHLGGHLLARGALATITTLESSGIYFLGEGMTNLMNGLGQSGHYGRTIRSLEFTRCNTSYDDENDAYPG
jgi:hypothetical protein